MYPLALVDPDGLVVVFSSFSTGTVFRSDGAYLVGFHTAGWDMTQDWQPFTGTIMANFA